MSSTKASVRKQITAKRDAQTQQQITVKSLEIKKRLFESHEFNKASTVMFYASIKSEVNTSLMIKQALSSNKKIVLPKVCAKKQFLLPYLINDYNTEIEKGVWGIPEPKKELTELVDFKQIDLVIVPGIAFDPQGHRLGYGKGFYDRFLSKLEATAHIGLAFELQIAESLPHNQEDVAVEKIITEERIITCRGS